MSRQNKITKAIIANENLHKRLTERIESHMQSKPDSKRFIKWHRIQELRHFNRTLNMLKRDRNDVWFTLQVLKSLQK